MHGSAFRYPSATPSPSLRLHTATGQADWSHRTTPSAHGESWAPPGGQPSVWRNRWPLGSARTGTVRSAPGGPVGAPVRLGDTDSEDRREPQSRKRAAERQGRLLTPPGSDGRDPRSRAAAQRRGRPGGPDARCTGPHRQGLSHAGQSGSWRNKSPGEPQEHSGPPSHHGHPAVTGETPPLSESAARARPGGPGARVPYQPEAKLQWHAQDPSLAAWPEGTCCGRGERRGTRCTEEQ